MRTRNGKTKPSKQQRLANSNQRAIEARRLALRSGMSISDVCRQRHDFDAAQGEWRKVRNRKTWARNPDGEPEYATVPNG